MRSPTRKRKADGGARRTAVQLQETAERSQRQNASGAAPGTTATRKRQKHAEPAAATASPASWSDRAGYLSASYVDTQCAWLGLERSSAHQGFSCASCGTTPIVGDRHLAAKADAQGRHLNFCSDCVNGSAPAAMDLEPFEVFAPQEGTQHTVDATRVNAGTHRLSELQWAVLRLVFATGSHPRLGEAAWTVGADMDVFGIVGEKLLSIARARQPGQVWAAARSDSIAQLVALLQLGADVNDPYSADAMNPSPLFIAVRLGHRAATDVLLANEADVTILNCRAGTCLSVAAQSGYASIVAQLLRVTPSVDVDRQNYQGSTPLTLAAQNGHFETAKLLVKAGADKTLTCMGMTAKGFAEQGGHHEIVEYLAQDEVGSW